VLTALGNPPAPGTDELAAQLARRARPGIARRTVAAILREWREYASLAAEDDWDE
jgi:hypothetical protein